MVLTPPSYAQNVPCYDPVSYGADPSGTNDSSAAFNSAIVAAAKQPTGGTVCVRDGHYNIASKLTLLANVSISGEAEYSTQISSTITGDDVILASGGNNAITNLTILSAAVQSSGYAAIHVTGSGVKIRNIDVWANCSTQYFGSDVKIDNYAWDVRIDGSGLSCATTANLTIGYDDTQSGRAAADIYVSNTIMGSGFEGILLYNASGVYLQNIDVIGSTAHGFITYPGSGQYVESIFATNALFDTPVSDDGIAIVSNGGSSSSLMFTNCWSSSGKHNGVRIGPNSGDNVSFIGGAYVNNAYNGFLIDGGGNIILNGVTVAGNSQNGLNQYDGIYIAGNHTGGVTITNSIAGYAGQPKILSFPKNQRYGINIGPGANNYIVQNNRCLNNVTGGFYDGGTGTNKIATNGCPAW